MQKPAVDALDVGVPIPYLSGRQISPSFSLHPFFHLNSRGLWKVDGRSIQNVALDRYPVSEGVANGNFILPENRVLDLGGNIQSGPGRSEIILGELKVFDEPSTASVESELTCPTGEVDDAFVSNGFKHDVRDGVGWMDSKPVILGPARVAPSGRFTGFDFVTGEKN